MRGTVAKAIRKFAKKYKATPAAYRRLKKAWNALPHNKKQISDIEAKLNES